MSSDRSRLSDRPQNLYAGVVAQQGRVILDRDVNDLQEILLRARAAEVRDIVGPCGTPDDGFRIDAPNPSPAPPFWSPPEAATASPPEAPGGPGDFLIGPGSMYLGGHRVVFPPRPQGQSASYSYRDQPDWPVPDAPPDAPANELVYLDVTLQEISAVEDPDLLEVALGGPDTTQRLRFLQRVKRQAVNATDCASAWQQALTAWTQQGLTFNPATMRLAPTVRLQVSFSEDAGKGDPCDPTVTGGYLGADNQLLRVQVTGTGREAAVVWGYDNASFLYRVTAISPDGTTVTLASDPPDAFHTPQAGQIVEILTTASIVAVEPDATDPAGLRHIERVAAEAVGAFHALAAPYGPTTQGDPTSYIVLDRPLDPTISASTLPVFLRVWQAALPLVLDTPVTLYDPATGLTTGLEVTLSGATIAADGAYWLIAARPSTPQAVYPEDLLTASQPADGPFRLVCPLAVIDWETRTSTANGGPIISDCRNGFDTLVDLSKRRSGCCTVSVTPADLAGTPLQALIDRAAAQAEQVTVCLAAGLYPIAESLRLGPAHAGLVLESCGGPATLEPDAAADPTAFADGLVVVAGVSGVRLSGLTLRPPPSAALADFRSLLVDRLATAEARKEAVALLRDPHVSFGVRAYFATDLTLERCEIAFAAPSGTADDLIGAAVFLQGDCAGLRIRDCTFGSAMAPTYTPIGTQQNADRFNLAGAEKAKLAPAGANLLAAAAAPQNFADIMASRSAAPYAQRTTPICATTAVLALSARASTATTSLAAAPQPLACSLGDAEIRGNRMHDLTLGTFLLADAAALRLQDNTASDCVAGLWAFSSSPQDPTGLPEGTQYYDSALYFEELLMLAAYASLASLPRILESKQTGAPPTIERSAPAPLNPVFFVSGNNIVTGAPGVPEDGRQTQGYPGRAALFAWLGGTPAADVSLIVNANHLASNDISTPTALIILPENKSCAITGNIVINAPALASQQAEAPSLWVLMDNLIKLAEPLAAAGNVLRGPSNLAQYDRPPARPGWSSYNADPT